VKPAAYGEITAPAGARLVAAQPLAAGARIVIVASRFHSDIVQQLVDGVYAGLAEAGVTAAQTTLVPVPGAFELPVAARAVAASSSCVAVIALGCVIRGGTPHFDYICAEAARGITLASLETRVPIIFGVLTVDSRDQALERLSKGREFAAAAVELAGVLTAASGA
jgi:6,7-dimethyl-8-ribityllumazine synthase